MNNNQRTNEVGATARDRDVRAHEQAQYATPPSLPTLPTQPTEEKTPNSTPVRPTGFRTAREETPGPRLDDRPEPIDDTRRIVGYRINRTNSTVYLASLTGPITDILKRKTWATLIRDEGWAFPLSYLAHVEKLLAGADIPIEVFNIEGGPTPGQQARERREERGSSAAVLADIRAARKASQTDQQAIHEAREACKAAYRDAVATHPPIEHRDETSTP